MPLFLPFEGIHTIARHRRNLPHWTAPGATYYLTFRLADSFPKSAEQEWKTKLQEFLSHFRVSSPQELAPKNHLQYRKIFGRVLHQTLDQGHGSCLLKDPRNRQIVTDALLHFDNDRYHLGDFVIMPNHVHLLVVLAENIQLSDILHSWKSFTAKAINKLQDRSGKFWQDETYDHIVRGEIELNRIIKYIAENPTKAHLTPPHATSRHLTPTQFTHHTASWTFKEP